jgi:hypothetical protein
MASIGVYYNNKEDRELILDYSACHPNLLQFFCKHLMGKIEKHDKVENRRTIFREDIEELFDTEYEEYIMDEIYMFSMELSDINKLILILLVEDESYGKSFSANEIRDKLLEIGILININDVNRNLKNLVMRFILLDLGKDNYCFALSFFPGILKNRIDDSYKKSIIKEIKRNDSKSL